MDMRDHALELAAKGFRVIPLHWPILDTIDGKPLCSCNRQDCSSIGKHPLTAHGVKDAQSGQGPVTSWWKEYPEANIGVATGFDFDVIDIDGPEGLAAYTALAASLGDPRVSGCVETGREGGHHLYTLGGGMQSWTGGSGGFPVHLDCKGRGGYVVAPPSLHASGKRYTWSDEYQPGYSVAGAVDWPHWHVSVRESVAPPARPRAWDPSDELVIRQPSVAGTGLCFSAAVRASIVDRCRAATQGGRWQTFQEQGVWRFAGLILGGEAGYDEALAELTELACAIPLDPGEIARVPVELDRALRNRRDPIQSRASIVAALGLAVSGSDPDPEALSRYEEELAKRVALRKFDLIVAERAKDELRQEKLAERPIEPFEDLPVLMAERDETTQYRIDGLWPVDGRTMLAAQFKAGKTTMVGNVVRCLADSARFLGRYQANMPDGRITVVDTEMTRGMFRSWLREQAIANQEKVNFKLLRGACSTFNILDEMTRAAWAQQFKDAETEVLILDCLGPILAAIGMNESVNEDVGKFIGAFEELVAEADIRESMIVHHMGHAGERSRGASRLRDWPDVEWHLIRQGQENDEAPAPDVPRYFRAYGRDVSTPEQLLHYEPNMRWLSVNGEGSRGDVRANRIATDLIEMAKKEPGMSKSGITNAVKGRAEDKRRALGELVLAGTLYRQEGPHRSERYFHSDYSGPLSEM